MTDQSILEANQITSQHVLSHYLPSTDSDNVWTHEGACISCCRIANRYGVPPDASTWRYRVEHPEFGWSYNIRAVWRCGRLMPPLATHVVIEGYSNDDEAQLPDEATAILAINEWLCSI